MLTATSVAETTESEKLSDRRSAHRRLGLVAQRATGDEKLDAQREELARKVHAVVSTQQLLVALASVEKSGRRRQSIKRSFKLIAKKETAPSRRDAADGGRRAPPHGVRRDVRRRRCVTR